MKINSNLEILLKRGVTMPLPGSVLIGDEVDPERISNTNVTLYPGTKISGKNTLIMSDVSLGRESPVTVDNCLMGPGTELKGGFFQGAVFAGSNRFGSGAHVREGTILEEYASAAHTVGLKQTLLFPFVTLGSLINFCDCFMAGGTGHKDHSEVGSSFIHFNYTPNQDKATPSMFGNVHHGVMLNCRPVFLGGQGGVVGPCRLAFGSVTAAGTICRKDELRPDRIILGGALKDGSIPRRPHVYTSVKRVYFNNCRYIAAMIALLNWYRNIREFFVDTDNTLEKALNQGMMDTLDKSIDERIKRLEEFCRKLEISKHRLLSKSCGKQSELIIFHDLIIKKRPELKKTLVNEKKANYFSEIPEDFLNALKRGIFHHGKKYIPVIKRLDADAAASGSVWLENIENKVMKACDLESCFSDQH
ncbi:MAG: protein GlmU [Desulfobacteraceae bacterium]